MMLAQLPYEKEKAVFGNTLLELAEKDERVAVFDADLGRATETKEFKAKFPNRHFNIGIAESNMVSMAAGYARSGGLAICGTFASFVTRRVCDQIEISCALNDANVRLIGVEPGIVSGRNGATHQAVDDIAITRSCPNMTVIDPADATEVRQILHASLKHSGPVYLRMLRGESPVIFDRERSECVWGKARQVLAGDNVTIVTTGIMLERCLAAATALGDMGIGVDLVHMPFIKPFDHESVIQSARKTGSVVSVENHSVLGGLGSAVAEALSEAYPVPVRRIGIPDCFGECGEPSELFDKFGMSEQCIVDAVLKTIERK